MDPEYAPRKMRRIEGGSGKATKEGTTQATVINKLARLLGRGGAKLDRASELLCQFISACDLASDVNSPVKPSSPTAGAGAEDAAPVVPPGEAVAAARAAGVSTVQDALYDALFAATHPFGEQCTAERAPALGRILTRLHEVNGKTWAGFSPEQAGHLKLMQVAAVAHANAITDDTYQFAAAVKQLVSVVESITESEEASPLAADRVGACMAMMPTLTKYAKKPWAKTPVDVVFREAAKRRHFFTHDNRELLDAWTSSLSALRSSAVAAASHRAVRNVSAVELNPLGTRGGRIGGAEASKVVGVKLVDTIVPKAAKK